MKKTCLALLVSVASLCNPFASAWADDVVLTDADLTGAYKKASYGRGSVHDPSIVYDTISNPSKPVFYVIGSHLGFRRNSTAVSNIGAWPLSVGGGETANCTLFADTTGKKVGFADAYTTHRVTRVKNYQGETVPFGNFDAHGWQFEGSTVAGNQWAPDMVYNPTMQKWLLYESLNGDHWGSSIVCFAADKPTGPFIYQGPVVFSGFQGTYAHNGYEAANDWTHTDLAIATGATSLPSRYAKGGSWGTYWPNCIDPCVFYDEEGRLWMSYGSWSGGIWMLELDETTGLRDYTVTYPIAYSSGSDAANQISDPYFGKKIAGGWYVSGEGSYIEHIGQYYYLFISYGFYSPDGGYEMRVFRSENPDGPYQDAKKQSPIMSAYKMNYGTSAASSAGVKLMGGYQWDLMPKAEIAQGHNSAFTDRQGRSYVIYHTKFNDGTAGHEVRVHQLFTNADGWLVAAPFEFHNETVTQAEIDTTESIGNDEIPGNYQLVAHNIKVNYQEMAYQKPVDITLTANADDPYSGKVSSSYAQFSGTWTRIQGTDYIEMKLGSLVHRGVLTRQTVDYSNIAAVCFSVVSSGGQGAVGTTAQRSIWGVKAEARAAIKYTLDNLTLPVTDQQEVQDNLTLPATGSLGARVSWTSSDESVLTGKGVVSGSGIITLTLHVAKDGYDYQKPFTLKVGDYSAITDVREDASEPQPYYDLQGRRVQLPQQRGIYITGGKKVLVQ